MLHGCRRDLELDSWFQYPRLTPFFLWLFCLSVLPLSDPFRSILFHTTIAPQV